MIVADTDVLIDYLRGRGAADRVALELRTGALATTCVSAFELWAGARTKKQRTAVDALLAAVPILALEASAARRAAEVRQALEGSGRPIGMADSLIAGLCLEAGAILLTRNHRHFERVDGLRLTRSSEA